MTVQVKEILKPNAVESAEDEMPDRMKSSDISSEIDFLKRIKLKAQILQSAQALAGKTGFEISQDDVAAASFESQEDKRKKKFYSKLIKLYNESINTDDADKKLEAKKNLAYLYSVYGMKDLYELACDLSKIQRTQEHNSEALSVSENILGK
jgi:hypothetical protein